MGQDYPLREEATWRQVNQLLDRAEEAAQEVLDERPLFALTEESERRTTERPEDQRR